MTSILKKLLIVLVGFLCLTWRLGLLRVVISKEIAPSCGLRLQHYSAAMKIKKKKQRRPTATAVITRTECLPRCQRN